LFITAASVKSSDKSCLASVFLAVKFKMHLRNLIYLTK